MRVPLLNWQSHVSEGTPLSEPVTIKIRSRRSAQKLLERTGFRVDRYYKRGFVQNYLPPLGKMLHPDGWVLNGFGAALGWYHVFICSKAPQSDPNSTITAY